MRHVALAALLLMAMGTIGAPARARAQYLVCNTTRCETPIGCDRADCSTISVVSDAVCGSFDEGPDGMSGLVFCHPACGTIFDCQAGLDPRCPVLGGELGECGAGLQGGFGFLVGVCRFPAWGITYCVAADVPVPGLRFTACHTDPATGAAEPNYLLGDCDGDHCPNNRDPDPCVMDPAGACPPASGLEPICAAPGATPPSRDGGVSVLDAGASTDAGRADGATVSGLDAAATMLDAASADGALVAVPDASAFAMDGAPVSPPSPGISFRGGGGCACRAVFGSTRAAWSTLAALAWAAMVVRLRRRRAPG